MSKKVLVLSASPRKDGNSDLLCNQFIEGANSGENEVEKFFIGDIDLKFCKACDYCQKNNGKCIHNDMMGIILEKMINFDVIVISTPIYFYAINGQIKTLIDRVYARYNEIKNKDFYFIMTAADGKESAMDTAIEELRGFTSCLFNSKEKGIIRATGVWNKGDVIKRNFMQEAFEMGQNI